MNKLQGFSKEKLNILLKIIAHQIYKSLKNNYRCFENSLGNLIENLSGSYVNFLSNLFGVGGSPIIDLKTSNKKILRIKKSPSIFNGIPEGNLKNQYY